MPYIVRPKGNEWCVYKEGEDGKPTGKAIGCSPSKAKAQAQQRALYAAEARDEDKQIAGMEKVVGSVKIMERLEEEAPFDEDEEGYPVRKFYPIELFADWVLLQAHGKGDGSTLKLYKLPLTISGEDVTFDWENMQQVERIVNFRPKFVSIKGTDGVWRWASLSGSSFKDRDKEIISKRSLEAAIALMDKTGDYGPLRLYHVKGSDMGKCLASALCGNFLAEAGVWDDTPLATKAREWAETHPEHAGMSIKFAYDKREKRGKVYEGAIRIVERSLLDVKDAACPWTRLIATVEEVMGNKADVAKIVGDELAEQLFKDADGRTKQLIDEGVEFKSVEEVSDAVAAEESTETNKEAPADGIAEASGTETAPADEAQKEPEAAQEKVTEPEPAPEPQQQVLIFDEASAKMIADAVGVKLAEYLEAQKRIVEELVKGFNERVDAVDNKIAPMVPALEHLLKTDADKVKEQLAMLPKTTLKGFSARPTADPELKKVDVSEPDAEDKEKEKVAQKPRSIFEMTLEESVAYNRSLQRQ